MINFVPGLDILCESPYNLTVTQAYILGAEIWLFVLLYLILLAMSAYNIIVFLIKRQKYKVLPLTVFYAMTVFICLCRITQNLGLAVTSNYFIFVLGMPVILKLNIGLV